MNAPHSNECANCQRTDTIENPVETHMIERWTPLCDDCAAEHYRLEAVADQLVAQPSCPERERIINDSNTTGELVNRLRAHDLTGCLVCAEVPRKGERTGRMAGAQATTNQEAA